MHQYTILSGYLLGLRILTELICITNTKLDWWADIDHQMWIYA